MVTTLKSTVRPHRLAVQLRERFVLDFERVMVVLGLKIQQHLTALNANGRFASVAESRQVLDTAVAFQREQERWVSLSRKNWQAALSRTGDAARGSDLGALGLVDDEEVERKIIVSRMAAAVTDAAGSELNDLRLRMQSLERVTEWGRHEVLAPETALQILVKAWIDCDLTRPMWTLVQAPATELLSGAMAQGYRKANEFLVEQGVMSEIDMRSRVRRTDGAEGSASQEGATDPASARAAAQGAAAHGNAGSTGSGAAQMYRGAMPGAREMARQPGQTGRQAEGAPQWQGQGQERGGSYPASRSGYAAHQEESGRYMPGGAAAGTADTRGMAGGTVRQTSGLSPRYESGGARYSAGGTAYGTNSPETQIPPVQPTALARAAQETRMLTGVTPMARVRQRAQGVLGQLRRLIADRIGDFDDTATVAAPSPQLARALAEPGTPFEATEWVGGAGSSGAGGGQPLFEVQRVAAQLRKRADDLKEKAEKPSEKATIEIVALMFQAILAEERIPATMRVWFARLQLPVLRLALAEPDFFASIQHPARQLIDRMGACVLGFDGAQIVSSRLEREIKRVVQVIEQYPETGRRVYQLVLDEFKKFLGRSLTDSDAVQQAATLAQQVEQKEALSIQYTIELRRMLDPVPVADDVREFLFRVWSEVLALSAVRYGAQQAETLRLKQAAADLLWAVSPKPDREDRRRVVQQLSGLLQALRGGMAMLAMPENEQDGHVKLINDAVTAAFVSRDEGLPKEKLDDLARGLAGLEDVVTDDPEGDVLLDPGMIEMMFGVDGDALEVIATGGSMPSDGMVDWARALELGAWFGLDVSGAVKQVQYVWRSARGQLHLFSAGAGKSYLVQTRRMAAYLQAGLLVPIEDEALTVRATRQALAKLNSEPERLLQ